MTISSGNLTKKIVFPAVLFFPALLTNVIFHSTQQFAIHYQQGRRLFVQGRYAQALPFFEQAVRLGPMSFVALRDLAFSYQWTGRSREALPLLEKAARIRPMDRKIREALADAYAWNGQYSPAIKLYESLLQDDLPITLSRKLAETYLSSRQYGKAKTLLFRMLEIYPQDMRSQLLWAKALQYSGDYGAAIEVYQKLLKKVSQ